MLYTFFGRTIHCTGMFLWTIGAACVLSSAGPTFGHDVLQDGGVTPDEAPGQSGGRGSGEKPPESDDPVYLDTGEFAVLPDNDLTTPDLRIPVRGHMIDLRRTYRSNYFYHGVLGFGWEIASNRRLRQVQDGSLVITSGNGRTDTFSFAGAGWFPPVGVFRTVEQNPDGSYTETSPDGTRHLFDEHGNLVERSDRHGNTIRYEYSQSRVPIFGRSQYFTDTTPRIVAAEYQLLRMTDPVGREIQFAYNPNGRIESITDWIGRSWAYAYDALGNLTAVTSPPIPDFPNGTTTTYQYTDARFPNKITRVIPPTGQADGTARVENVYDDEGRVVRQEQGDGAVVTMTYEPDRTLMVDGNGTTWIYKTENGRTTSETVVTHGVRPALDEPIGTEYVSTFGYENQLQTVATTPEGARLERVFDATNPNVLARRNLLQHRRVPKPGSSEAPLITTFTYKTPFQQLGTITDERGKVTEHFYDANHDLERIRYPATPEGIPERSFTTNAFGQRETVTDENGNTTRFVYDANGYLSEVIRADGTPLAATTALNPDAVGRPTLVRDSNGRETEFDFNAWDLVERRTEPGPFLYRVSLAFDENGNLVRIDRDSADPADPQTRTLTYTIFDEVATTSNELGQTYAYAYDGNRNRSRIEDPEGNVQERYFDERNLLYRVVDAENRETIWNYHPDETVSEIVDGGDNSTLYTYDAFNRPLVLTYADSTTMTMSHDASSNVTQVTTRAGQIISFEYDARNRVRERNSASENATFAYDLGGRLVSAANAEATIDLAYDARDQLESETITLAGLGSFVVGHEFDGEGNHTRTTYPDGIFVDYVYDELNRLRIVRDDQGVDQVRYTYDELSRLAQVERASGVSSSRTFDPVGRLSAIRYELGPTLIELFGYSYDPTGSLSEFAELGGTYQFTYDRTKQLTSVDYPAASPFADVSYEYDDARNRTQTVTASGATVYTRNALNQYTSVGAATYSYDLNGNLTGDGENTYAFDEQGRLVSAVLDAQGMGTVSAEYAYDPFMRRTRKTVDGASRYFLWTQDRLLEEYDASGDRTTRYVLDGSYLPVQVGIGPGLNEPRHDVHGDHLDTPRLITDASGAVSWRAQYEAFGAFRVDPGSSIEFDLRFPGQYADPESGLHYNLFRYFDPEIGRYLQPDPIGQLGGVEVYAYAANKPTGEIDPIGLQSRAKLAAKVEEETGDFLSDADKEIVIDFTNALITWGMMWDLSNDETHPDYIAALEELKKKVAEALEEADEETREAFERAKEARRKKKAADRAAKEAEEEAGGGSGPP